MLIVIDNYDSFTYNLVQYFGELGAKLKVFRHDQISVEQVQALKPSHLVISPGPGRPEDAGISKELILSLYQQIPILGVCLGHQCIGEVFGGKTVHAPSLMHGKTSAVYHNDSASLFASISSPFTATRYHSLVLDPRSLPTSLTMTAWTEDNVIMAIQHVQYPTFGIQFHPESILTTEGKLMLKNFLAIG